MAWVIKGDNRYYYRSVRIDGKVRRIYCGANEAADKAASEHKKEQEARKEKTERRKQEWEEDRCYRWTKKELTRVFRLRMQDRGYSRSRRGIWRLTSSSSSSPKPIPA